MPCMVRLHPDLLARLVPNERDEQAFWQNLASVLELSRLA